jgi:hypothetical protein
MVLDHRRQGPRQNMLNRSRIRDDGGRIIPLLGHIATAKSMPETRFTSTTSRTEQSNLQPSHYGRVPSHKSSIRVALPATGIFKIV